MSNTTLRERFYANRLLPDCPVYDMHGHMGPLQGAALPRCSPEAMIRSMEHAGVRMTVFCHHDTLHTPDIGNQPNIETVRRYPEAFRAYCGINPNHPEQVREDLQTYSDHTDVYVGFKFLADYHRIPISDAGYAPALDYADAEELLVLLHTWGGSAYDGEKQVRICAERYPNARLLMGHSCHGNWREAGQIAAEFPNVYLELTAVLDDRGALEILVEEAGSENILFGTDTPWFNHHYSIGAVIGADITDEDRRNILYRNAEKLLKPFGCVQ